MKMIELVSLILNLKYSVFSVSPAQQRERRSYNDPFSDFDNGFQTEFDEMDEDERIHSELEVKLFSGTTLRI